MFIVSTVCSKSPSIFYFGKTIVLKENVHETIMFSPGTPVSPNNNTDRHDIAEMLLKVALNTINYNHKSSE
jgi:hypothetical protein